MKKRIVRFLTGGCVVNTVLITAVYLFRELFLSDMPEQEVSFRIVCSVLLISFILSGADLLLEKKTVIRIMINYAVTIAGVLITFRIMRGKYDGGMQIAAVAITYTVLYALITIIRFTVSHFQGKKNVKGEEYLPQFK